MNRQQLQNQLGQIATEYILVMFAVLITFGLVAGTVDMFCKVGPDFTAEDCKSAVKAFSRVFQNHVTDVTTLINLPF